MRASEDNQSTNSKYRKMRGINFLAKITMIMLKFAKCW